MTSLSTDKLTELLPCPFCGVSGNAKTIHIRDGRRVTCRCGAAGSAEFHGRADQASADDRAIAAWNTRAPSPEVIALRAENARLREAAELALAALSRGDLPVPAHKEDEQAFGDYVVHKPREPRRLPRQRMKAGGPSRVIQAATIELGSPRVSELTKPERPKP